MMDFKDKVAVITGGAQGIGRCIAEEFQKAGAHVCVIDRQEGEHFVGDIADKDTLERFAREVIERYGCVDYLINNALPVMLGIDTLCSDKAGFITGENICIDGGMTRQMIYHGDNGWKLELSSNVV